MFPFLNEAIWKVINNSLPAVSFTNNFKNCTQVYLNNRILDTVSTCWFSDYFSTWGYLWVCWILYCHTLYWKIYLGKFFYSQVALSTCSSSLHAPPTSAACC